jgi:hypothetical protein
MIRRRTTLVSMALMVMGMLASLGLAQLPVPPAGSGTVLAVDTQGMATVKVGEKQQTVHLPDAKVGDQVDCKVSNEKWQCTVKPK